MDDNNFQNSLCITSMKQKLSGPTEAHGPFIIKCYLLDTKWPIFCTVKQIHSIPYKQKFLGHLTQRTLGKLPSGLQEIVVKAKKNSNEAIKEFL